MEKERMERQMQRRIEKEIKKEIKKEMERKIGRKIEKKKERRKARMIMKMPIKKIRPDLENQLNIHFPPQIHIRERDKEIFHYCLKHLKFL
ncbi:MAG: hypothetical protein IPH84_15620 [Bacteroidales bacterium]|nr:hypothetical protein [Bacteroidales bacterium]